ncbi:MAG: PilZ domain-containing protein [Acidobacteria bacterium]|nr:PilZ domain-containing protein [Acidobacteriota bacterium]
MSPEPDTNSPILCLFLNLDSKPIEIDSRDLRVESVRSIEEIHQNLAAAGDVQPCILVGVSRNLMTHYLTVSGLFFSPQTSRVPTILITHASNKIAEHKSFLFGKRPYPVSRVSSEFIRDVTEVKLYNVRTFHRIAVEFVAFAVTETASETIPAVCKNISWGGTFFETREEIVFNEFRLLLRSKLHRIEIPSRIIRRKRIEEDPPRFGYGVRFQIPLPLTLIHYMYAKYMKDHFGIV